MEYQEAFEAAGTLGKAQECITRALAANGTISYDKKCIDGCQKYIYKTEEVKSVISEFDLACGGNKVLATISNSAFWVSGMIACFVIGYVGDRFGRKPPNLLCIVIFFLSSTAATFSPNIWFYIAMRFFCGFGYGGFSQMSFLIMAETVERKYLAHLSMGAQVIFAVGEIIGAGVGYASKNSWRLQVLIVSLPLIAFFLLYLFVVPESPMWLYSKEKYDKAEKILKNFARLNKRDPSVITLSPLEKGNRHESRAKSEQSCSSPLSLSRELGLDEVGLIDEKAADEQNESIIDLFRTWHAFMLTAGQISAWFAVALVYYGLTFDAGNIGGDSYVNSMLLAVIEFPVWLISFVMNRFGRKKTFYICLLLSSAACLILPFTEPLADGTFQIIFAMVGKCMAAAAFDLLYTYTPELYPTVLRGTGLLMCSASSRIATIFAPFVTDLKYGIYDCTPYIIFSASGFISSVFIIFYGIETLGRPLSTTLEEFYTVAREGGANIEVKNSDDNGTFNDIAHASHANEHGEHSTDVAMLLSEDHTTTAINKNSR